MRPTFEKPNARTIGPARGAALGLLAALGLSLKAIFVKLAYPNGVEPRDVWIGGALVVGSSVPHALYGTASRR